MLRTLYVDLVRPHLDYACVIWNPYQLGDMRAIEIVQRKATRLTPGMKTLCYHDHLATLNMFTYSDTITRSNGYKLFKHHSRLRNTRKYSFLNVLLMTRTVYLKIL